MITQKAKQNFLDTSRGYFGLVKPNSTINVETSFFERIKKGRQAPCQTRSRRDFQRLNANYAAIILSNYDR